MSKTPAPNLIEQADAAGVVLFSSAIALPTDGSAPDWITLFPKTGRVETRDGRAFDVSAATLMAAFKADALDLPIDVNHSTDAAGMFGGRADAVGWGTELREQDGALQIKVDWLPEGRELLSSRKYRYTSPSFYQDQNRATRLKAVALVTSPALGRQPALARAGGSSPQEPSMKSIAKALGLSEGADEAACLSAVTALSGRSVSPAIRKALGVAEAADEAACLAAIGAMVPKGLHDQTVANLSSASQRIDALEKAGRDKEVAGLLDDALKARKITPAQVATLSAMCATDEGLTHVKAHIAASTPGLQPSGLDDRGQPSGGGGQDASTLAAAAQKIQDERKAAGSPIGFAEAVTLATKVATKA